MLDGVAPGVCSCGRVASEPHQCEYRLRPEWRTPDGAIDPSLVPCPCCAEIPWCPAERAAAQAEVLAAPELVMGAAPYGRRP